MIAETALRTARVNMVRALKGKARFMAFLVCVLVASGPPPFATDPFDRHGPVTISRWLWSLLTGASELGLTESQIERVSSLAATYHVALHRAEQEIALAQRELHGIVQDHTVDLSVIEDKLKDIEALKTHIQLIGIKAWRDARGLLTAEQRERLRAFHAIPRLPESQPFDQRTSWSIVNSHSSIVYEERGRP